MWSLSLEDIERVEERAEGAPGRAEGAVRGRTSAVEADLANIETLELAGTLFVSRYQSVEAEGLRIRRIWSRPRKPSRTPSSRASRATGGHCYSLRPRVQPRGEPRFCL